MSVKTGPIIVHNKRDLWNEMDDETEDIYLQAVRYIMLQLEDI